MSQATQVLGARSAGDTRLIALVSTAHFVSHFYLLLLPPLFPFVRAEYGVSYTELGIALAAFNIVSAALQTPAGFLVDWLGARALLIGGLLVGAGAIAAAGLVDSFWVFVGMFALAGAANTVYHPADYALLSHQVAPARISKAFSVHSFAGMLGSAAAPACLLLLQSVWGWRGAFIGASLLGAAAAAAMIVQGEEPVARVVSAKEAETAASGPTGWRLLLSTPILLNFLFFALLALNNGGLVAYSVVALNALNGTPVAIGNTALSAFLLLSAIGILAGGWIAGRTKRHGGIAAAGLAVIALVAVALGTVNLGTVLLIAVMSIGGFCYGVIMPARDLIVREMTPPGSFGKVFGFVTTAFNVSGIVSPIIFGAVMDNGTPQLVFLLVAAFTVISIFTVIWSPARAR